VEPRLSLVTLGVADVARARAFYEKLGFAAPGAGNESVAFFPAGGVVLALYGRKGTSNNIAFHRLGRRGDFRVELR